MNEDGGVISYIHLQGCHTLGANHWHVYNKLTKSGIQQHQPSGIYLVANRFLTYQR
jgi:hypothetical protein